MDMYQYIFDFEAALSAASCRQSDLSEVNLCIDKIFLDAGEVKIQAVSCETIAIVYLVNASSLLKYIDYEKSCYIRDWLAEVKKQQ